MTDTRIPSRVFANASQDAETAREIVSTPQTQHPHYQLAFQDTTARVLAHSLLGCAFYGAFATKVVVVRSR